jgi:hypothetical protein
MRAASNISNEGPMVELDAVLPLIPRDLARFAVLSRSLERYFEGLGRLYVVVPEGLSAGDVSAIRKTAGRLDIEIIPELHWAPEMSALFHLPGWYRQQILKLAAAEHVRTEYYLTLDADVVCTRATSADVLLPRGKSACFIMQNDEHSAWYEGAEAALRVRAPRGVLHNVTPVVWAKAGVLQLIARLDDVARRRLYAPGLRGCQQRLLFALHQLGPHRKKPPWRAWLAATRPWAEYAMYFTLLEATGKFEQYHFDSDYCIYDIERSIWWTPADFDAWDPAPLFEGSGPPYFAVIQSNTGLEPELVWHKLSPWLGQPSA